ncbi:MAG: LuxR C-terminal-related transcriptional regulator [Gemmatimonadota bacterium]|jgi:DNA-binding CsgD family transcriptional regulator
MVSHDSPVASEDLLEAARLAAERRSWREAHTSLVAARKRGKIPPDDLWRLALASYLLGEEQDFMDVMQEGYQAFLDRGDVLEAVRGAFWLGQHLASRGDIGRASGWFGRAARLVADHEAEGAARGYVLFSDGYRRMVERDYDASMRASGEATEIGRRCRDDDLTALAMHLQGRVLLRMGRVDEGLALLDEAMVAVAANELSPVASGLIYCSVIAACRDVWALGRAHEWTTALTDWCARQPDMIAYTGPCRVSRAEILQRRGEWSEALREARLAVDRFAQGSGPGTSGAALYRQGEVHRLRGEYAAAETAYRAASEAGQQPQPGLALLRLAQGEVDAAAASLHRALAETEEKLARARLLPAYVEILLALGDTGKAESVCDELEAIADGWGGRVLDTLAVQSRGATLLSAGDAESALTLLRRACVEWDALEAPYEAACLRVLLAAACARLGDEEGSELELSAARATFEQLGARADLSRIRDSAEQSPSHDHGLTPREVEVLGWLATGRTNRAIADTLSISEKTVARHVANIYAKLGLSSRSAATAYAYEHDLARPST